ncbi:MAG: hypothetical protein ACKVTZ_12725 [Bacteroidia bacterium]
MHIANPIYDVVFKYLMEDSKIAKLMISSIIGEEISHLRFMSQEFTGEFEEKKATTKKKGKPKPEDKLKKRLGLTVYRLDFSAKIKTKEGEEKQVIIELQKAKFPTDIMRFRKYLGDQFSNKENTRRVIVGGRSRKIGLPIISIYFLGHSLDHTTASVIKVSRQYTDLITNEIIKEKENFIESLTLDSYVIQIPFLTEKKRTELEILLSVFDQSQAIDKDHHILNMEEKDFPKKFSPVIGKLHQAIQDQEVKKRMEIEDNILDELEEMEREIEELDQKNQQMELKTAQVEQEKAQVEQEKARVEQENEALRKKIAELLAGKKEAE